MFKMPESSADVLLAGSSGLGGLPWVELRFERGTCDAHAGGAEDAPQAGGELQGSLCRDQAVPRLFKDPNEQVVGRSKYRVKKSAGFLFAWPVCSCFI